MRGGTGSRGYTIVEVMIFLAVSGLMFLIAAAFISGKQSKAEFKQGLASLKSSVDQTINDVGNGYFPSAGNFNCDADAPGPPVFTTGSNAQGTNAGNDRVGCTFMGKIMQFNAGGSSAGNYSLYTVAARQYAT